MDATPENPPSLAGSRSTLGLAGWILLTFLAPAAGAASLPGAWYAGLVKPSWNPPAWLFGPVWTTLYLLMAVAVWMVWRRGGWQNPRRPIAWYLVQLALNAAWSPLFFGMHQPLAALADIVLLLLAVGFTLRAFASVHRPAAFLLVPYLLWVSFATVLNWTLFQLNR